MSNDTGGPGGREPVWHPSGTSSGGAILDAVGCGLVQFDRNGRIVAVNDEVVELAGYPACELEGSQVALLLDDRDTARIGAALQSLYTGRTTEIRALDVDLRSPDGSTRPVELRLAPLDDDGTVDAVVGVVTDVSGRVAREQELERQSRRLAALNDLNAVVRDVTETLVEQSTREEIEQSVCERLAASDSCQFAWIGEPDQQHEEVILRTAAGVEDDRSDVTISLDPDDPESAGPTALAVRTREPQIAQDIRETPEYEPWRDHADAYGCRSSAAVPISHDGVLYGVLTVYAARERTFEGEELEIVSHLGQLVGHAINAVERKRGLICDEVNELTFAVRDVFDVLGVETSADGPVSFDRTIPVGDGTYLVYGLAGDEAVDALFALCQRSPHWEDVSLLTDEGGRRRFEVRLSEAPLYSRIASHGGSVRRATISDGTLTLVVHLPLGGDVRAVAETVRETFPSVELLAQRQTARTGGSINHVQRTFDERLTDRQRNVVEAAYFAGYFEWPRASSGEDVASSLGIAASTFQQHLRTAERYLFEALFTGTVTEE